MRKLIIITALAFTVPAFASDLSAGAAVGTDMASISQSLSQMGYEVRKTEIEDGKIEVYAVKDGGRYEIYVSRETGKVIRVKNK